MPGEEWFVERSWFGRPRRHGNGSPLESRRSRGRHAGSSSSVRLNSLHGIAFHVSVVACPKERTIVTALLIACYPPFPSLDSN